MNTDKNVYILGAGFSKELGVPLQDDFILAAKEVYFKDTIKYAHFKTVFEYQDKLSVMKKFLSYPLWNLEHLFNLLEMDLFYSKNDEIKSIKDDFVKLIRDVLLHYTPCPFLFPKEVKNSVNTSYNNYIKFLNLFITRPSENRVGLHEDTIITFNYDLAIEAAVTIRNFISEDLKNAGNLSPPRFKLKTIFEKENITTLDVRSAFFQNATSAAYIPDYDIYSEENNAIKFIKLHGSVNWCKENSVSVPFIIPPTWNKSDDSVWKLWNMAYQEIKSAKRIIIIGYSFPETDTYVKSLLALALNENKLLQGIYFINPDTDQVQKNCISLIDKFYNKYCAYKSWRFGEFIDSGEGRKFIKNNLNRDTSG